MRQLAVVAALGDQAVDPAVVRAREALAADFPAHRPHLDVDGQEAGPAVANLDERPHAEPVGGEALQLVEQEVGVPGAPAAQDAERQRARVAPDDGALLHVRGGHPAGDPAAAGPDRAGLVYDAAEIRAWPGRRAPGRSSDRTPGMRRPAPRGQAPQDEADIR